MGRKDCLWVNLNRKQKTFPELFDFLPLTFLLRNSYDAFLKHRHSRDFWILKPVDAARGEGIRVLAKTEPVKQNPSSFFLSDYLVSEYIPNPHLIKGYKYDIRVYACVTCLDPLRVL